MQSKQVEDRKSEVGSFSQSLQELAIILETPLKTQIDRLRAENSKLSAENASLKQHSQVLQSCWHQAQENYIRATTEAKVWAGRAEFKDGEIVELQQQVSQLLSHLNPVESVA